MLCIFSVPEKLVYITGVYVGRSAGVRVSTPQLRFMGKELLIKQGCLVDGEMDGWMDKHMDENMDR